MLILTGYRGDKIYVGDEIVVTFCGYRTDYHQQVIGIDAPKYIKILREKLINLNRRKLSDVNFPESKL